MSGIAPDFYITARRRRCVWLPSTCASDNRQTCTCNDRQHDCKGCDKSPRRFVASVQSERTVLHSRAYFREYLCRCGHPLKRGSWRRRVMSRPSHSRHDLGEIREGSGGSNCATAQSLVPPVVLTVFVGLGTVGCLHVQSRSMAQGTA